MTSALAVEELIIRPEVKLNLRPRKCHKPNSKPLLLHHSLPCIPSSPWPVAQLLSCCAPLSTRPDVGEESRPVGAAIAVSVRKGRQLVPSRSSGTGHSHPRRAKGISAVWRGRSALLLQDNPPSKCKKIRSPTAASLFSQQQERGSPCCRLPANQPRALRSSGCCRNRKASQWVPGLSRLSSVLVSAEGYFLQ